jgi:hypothetical protein
MSRRVDVLGVGLALQAQPVGRACRRPGFHMKGL